MTQPLSEEEIDRLARRSAGAKLAWFVHFTIYLAVNLFLFAISQEGWGTRRWSLFPVFGWGLGVTLHGIAVFVLGPGSAIRESMVCRERERIERRRGGS